MNEERVDLDEATNAATSAAAAASNNATAAQAATTAATDAAIRAEAAAESAESLDTAARLATPRGMDGVNFDGSGSITHTFDVSTAAATVEKVVAGTSATGTIAYGARLLLRFINGHTAATMNIKAFGGTALPVYVNGATPTPSLSAGYILDVACTGAAYMVVGVYPNLSAAVVAFTASSTLSNILTTDSLEARFAKISKWYTDLTAANSFTNKQNYGVSTAQRAPAICLGKEQVTGSNYAYLYVGILDLKESLDTVPTADKVTITSISIVGTSSDDIATASLDTTRTNRHQLAFNAALTLGDGGARNLYSSTWMLVTFTVNK
ncbi:MAG: hypothetical protein ACK5MN_03455 [Lachnospiraceae bacterium]